jgi:transposase
MRLPRFFNFENYEVKDIKEFLSDGIIKIFLERNSETKPMCHRCNGELGRSRGDHFMSIEALPIMGYRTYLIFRRYKYHCSICKKARSEKVEFLSEQTPHLTKDLAWWIGRICEIAPVSRVAELVGHDAMTTWRLDYQRMRQMAQGYRPPEPKRISVDEVYARKRKVGEKTKDNCFFTIITDLDTGKVIWVSFGRSKSSLDEFFIILGPDACKQIEVVATDQHEAYSASVNEFCPKATVVWDKFHVLQNFGEAVNETRIDLHSKMPPNLRSRAFTRGKHKYMFLKRANRRTDQEKRLIEEVMGDNEAFYRLEIIKERMLTLFDEPDETRALFVWTEIGDWIKRSNFKNLTQWYETMSKKWARLANYFKYRVTTSMSEGINNVIKMVKRRAFGYRNMSYFRLKIMQVCGYLNSRFIKASDQMVALK